MSFRVSANVDLGGSEGVEVRGGCGSGCGSGGVGVDLNVAGGIGGSVSVGVGVSGSLGVGGGVNVGGNVELGGSLSVGGGIGGSVKIENPKNDIVAPKLYVETPNSMLNLLQ